MPKKLLFISFFAFLPKMVQAQWVETNLPSEGGHLTSNDTAIYFSAFTIASSSDNGLKWNNLTDLRFNLNVNGPIFAIGTSLFTVAGDSGYIYHSTDYGVTWDSTCIGLPANTIHVNGYIGAIAGAPTNLFAGGKGVYRSTDSGSKWADVSKGIPTDAYIYALNVSGSYVYVGTYGYGVFRSSDSGKSWVACNNGLVARKNVPGSYLVISLASLGPYVFAGTIGEDEDTSYGVFRSTDSGKSWQHSSNGLTYFDSVNAFATEGTRIFAALDQGGVYSSSDSGQTWVSENNWPAFSGPHLARSIAATYQSVFVGTYLNGVWQRPLSEFKSSVSSNSNNPNLISIFPNPSPGQIIIRGAAGSMVVTNVLGEQVLSTAARAPSGGNVELDLSKLPSGTYFARIETARGVVVRRIVKQ